MEPPFRFNQDTNIVIDQREPVCTYNSRLRLVADVSTSLGLGNRAVPAELALTGASLLSC